MQPSRAYGPPRLETLYARKKLRLPGYRLVSSGCPLPRTITDRLPLEIVECFIAFLRTKIRSLYACTLVCRAWYHRSQTLLCSYIVIGSRRQYNALAQYALRSPLSKSYLAHTRSLTLKGPGLSYTTDFYNVPDWKTSTGRRQYFDVVPLVPGCCMPALRRLTFINLVYPPYHRNFALFMSRFSSLTRFSLKYFTFQSFQELRRLLHALPKLQELVLEHGHVLSWGASQPHRGVLFPSERAPALRRLVLSDPSPSLLVNFSAWALRMGSLEHVESLALSFRDQYEPDESLLSATDGILACPLSLRELEYTPCTTYMTDFDDGTYPGPHGNLTGTNGVLGNVSQ